jgi:hypothetical protein
MPKAASAALSQAEHCAASIVARFSDRALPATTLDSVCYSSLALDRSIAIRARFRIAGGHIVADTSSSEPSAPPQAATSRTEHEAFEAYRAMRKAAFGA